MTDLYNASFDLLINGSVIDAAIKLNEQATTFGNIVWIWPFLFLFFLILIAMKSESPAFVGIYVILGTIALGTRLPQLSTPVFAITLIFSIVIWLYSLFVSSKTE